MDHLLGTRKQQWRGMVDGLSQNIVSSLNADTLPRPMRASQPAVPSTYPNKRPPYTGDGPNTPKTRRTLFDFRGLFLWWVRQACVSYYSGLPNTQSQRTQQSWRTINLQLLTKPNLILIQGLLPMCGWNPITVPELSKISSAPSRVISRGTPAT